jgi:peptide/nickel transport system substrate-binding protein
MAFRTRTLKSTALAATALATTALGFLLAAGAQAQTLRVAVPGNDMASLDPYRATATLDVNVVNWVFNGLVRIKPGQINPELIEPDIAESWTSTPDKKEWTFKLRDNVQCQGDYGALTAEDVVFSLKRASAKETSSFFADYQALQSIEAPDAKTVKITLKEPVPSLLGLLVPYHGGNIVCRKAVEKLGDEFARTPIGTGPFQVVEYQPQQYVRLRANAKYFRGAPQIKEILFRYMASDSSRDLAFQSGEIDLVNGKFEDSWIKRMSQLPETTVDVIGPTEIHSIYLNTSQKPLDDIRVRQAIAHAVSRDALVKFRGTMLSKAADSVVPNGYLGHVPVPLPQYNPAEAKRLLAEAGFANGLNIKSIQTTLPAMLTTMQVVQSQLKASGINLELALVDHPTFHAQIRQDLSQVVYYGAARFPVADTFLTQFFDSASSIGKPTAVTNFAHCDAADAEIKAARTEPDIEKQKALWATAQKKIVDAVCAVPMYEMGQPWAWKNKLTFGYKVVGSLGLSPPIDETTRLAN